MAKTKIAVYLGEDHFTAVEVKTSKAGGELLRFSVYHLGETGFSREWLAKLWKKEYYGHNKVISLLPQNLVKYKTLSLPLLPDEQIQAAVRLEMDNSEAGSVYRIITVKREEQHTSVKIALIRDDELESFLGKLQDVGLTVEWFGLNHHGLQNYLAFNFDFLEGSGADLYLSFNNTYTEIGALTDTELLYRRVLPIGKKHLAEASPKYLPELIEGIRLSLASYQTTNSIPLPEQVWLFGEAKLEPEWLHRLTEALGISLEAPAKSRLSGVITGNHTAELAPLIGLALDESWLARQDWRINTFQQARRERERRRTMTALKAGLAGTLLIAGLFLGVQARAIRSEKNTAWLQGQKETVARLRKIEADTNQKINQLKELENWMERRGYELEFLRALQAGLPEETQITDLVMEDGVIKGLSGSTRSVSRLLEKLQRTPELQSFKLKGTITSDKNGMELFQLEGKFTPGEKKP
ncbi:MAG: PilN domain-containing protein [Bacteroidota bacterium]